MKRNFSEELDKNDVNYYELVNVASQSARMINEQLRTENRDIKQKVTTEALSKVLDGRVVVLKEDDN
jgi:hypothetical protein